MVVAGPVVVLPRASVAVTRIVNEPPTGNGPTSAVQPEDTRDIAPLSDPLGPVQEIRTDDSRDSSVTTAVTVTRRPEAVHVLAPVVRGAPTAGARSWSSETLIVALPPSQVTTTLAVARPSGRAERSASSPTRRVLPPPSRPSLGPTASHRARDESW